ncbi:MAG: ABC transporter permease [Halobacteriota archaeon]
MKHTFLRHCHKTLSRIYIDFSSSLKMLFRGGGSLFWMLAFPVILMLVFGAIYSNNIQYELAIQNRDESNTSIAFIQAINSTNAFKVHTVKPSEDADAYIKSNQISSMLIIPKGFGEQVQQNVAANTEPSTALRVDPTATGSATQNVFDSGQGPRASANNTTVAPAMLILKINQASLYGPGVSGVVNGVAKSFYSELTESGQLINVTNQQVYPSHFKFVDFFVPTTVSLAILTTGVLGTVAMNTQYRNNQILKKLATTPFKKSEWLVAKMLYQCVVIFIATGLVIVVAKLVYNVRLVPNPATLLLLFTGTICFTGIGMVIARFVKDEDAATAAASAVMFPMLFLAGIFIPLEQMPESLQALAKVLPLMYLNLGLRDAMVLGDTASALNNMWLVAIAGVIFFIVGATITDWREV